MGLEDRGHSLTREIACRQLLKSLRIFGKNIE